MAAQIPFLMLKLYLIFFRLTIDRIASFFSFMIEKGEMVDDDVSVIYFSFFFFVAFFLHLSGIDYTPITGDSKRPEFSGICNFRIQHKREPDDEWFKRSKDPGKLLYKLSFLPT